MSLKIENMKTLSLPDEISSRRLIFTSDHHLPGDRNAKEADFDHEIAKKFIMFQKEIVKNDLHIINGDFFEGWQFDLESMLKENNDVISLLLDSNVIFINGNHDTKIFEQWQKKKKERIPLYTEWSSGRKRVVARHGHAADPNNKDDNAWFGKFITEMVARFEKADIQIDNWQDWLLNVGNTPSKIDDGVFNKQKDIYTEFARKLVDDHDCDCVVFGHTHRASLEMEIINGRKRVLANTGGWLKGLRHTFIEIEGREIRLNCLK